MEFISNVGFHGAGQYLGLEDATMSWSFEGANSCVDKPMQQFECGSTLGVYQRRNRSSSRVDKPVPHLLEQTRLQQELLQKHLKLQLQRSRQQHTQERTPSIYGFSFRAKKRKSRSSPVSGEKSRPPAVPRESGRICKRKGSAFGDQSIIELKPFEEHEQPEDLKHDQCRQAKAINIDEMERFANEHSHEVVECGANQAHVGGNFEANLAARDDTTRIRLDGDDSCLKEGRGEAKRNHAYADALVEGGIRSALTLEWRTDASHGHHADRTGTAPADHMADSVLIGSHDRLFGVGGSSVALKVTLQETRINKEDERNLDMTRGGRVRRKEFLGDIQRAGRSPRQAAKSIDASEEGDSCSGRGGLATREAAPRDQDIAIRTLGVQDMKTVASQSNDTVEVGTMRSGEEFALMDVSKESIWSKAGDTKSVAVVTPRQTDEPEAMHISRKSVGPVVVSSQVRIESGTHAKGLQEKRAPDNHAKKEVTEKARKKSQEDGLQTHATVANAKNKQFENKASQPEFSRNVEACVTRATNVMTHAEDVNRLNSCQAQVLTKLVGAKLAEEETRIRIQKSKSLDEALKSAEEQSKGTAVKSVLKSEAEVTRMMKARMKIESEDKEEQAARLLYEEAQKLVQEGKEARRLLQEGIDGCDVVRSDNSSDQPSPPHQSTIGSIEMALRLTPVSDEHIDADKPSTTASVFNGSTTPHASAKRHCESPVVEISDNPNQEHASSPQVLAKKMQAWAEVGLDGPLRQSPALCNLEQMLRIHSPPQLWQQRTAVSHVPRSRESAKAISQRAQHFQRSKEKLLSVPKVPRQHSSRTARSDADAPEANEPPETIATQVLAEVDSFDSNGPSTSATATFRASEGATHGPAHVPEMRSKEEEILRSHTMLESHCNSLADQALNSSEMCSLLSPKVVGNQAKKFGETRSEGPVSPFSATCQPEHILRTPSITPQRCQRQQWTGGAGARWQVEQSKHPHGREQSLEPLNRHQHRLKRSEKERLSISIAQSMPSPQAVDGDGGTSALTSPPTKLPTAQCITSPDQKGSVKVMQSSTQVPARRSTELGQHSTAARVPQVHTLSHVTRKRHSAPPEDYGSKTAKICKISCPEVDGNKTDAFAEVGLEGQFSPVSATHETDQMLRTPALTRQRWQRQQWTAAATVRWQGEQSIRSRSQEQSMESFQRHQQHVHRSENDRLVASGVESVSSLQTIFGERTRATGPLTKIPESQWPSSSDVRGSAKAVQSATKGPEKNLKEFEEHATAAPARGQCESLGNSVSKGAAIHKISSPEELGEKTEIPRTPAPTQQRWLRQQWTAAAQRRWHVEPLAGEQMTEASRRHQLLSQCNGEHLVSASTLRGISSPQAVGAVDETLGTFALSEGIPPRTNVLDRTRSPLHGSQQRQRQQWRIAAPERFQDESPARVPMAKALRTQADKHFQGEDNSCPRSSVSSTLREPSSKPGLVHDDSSTHTLVSASPLHRDTMTVPERALRTPRHREHQRWQRQDWTVSGKSQWQTSPIAFMQEPEIMPRSKEFLGCQNLEEEQANGLARDAIGSELCSAMKRKTEEPSATQRRDVQASPKTAVSASEAVAFKSDSEVVATKPSLLLRWLPWLRHKWAADSCAQHELHQGQRGVEEKCHAGEDHHHQNSFEAHSPQPTSAEPDSVDRTPSPRATSAVATPENQPTRWQRPQWTR